ncbi:MAG: thioredoxin [Rickettsiaceae bacterium]|nr:thioredoxin [Rickettsiaceae bacterium]
MTNEITDENFKEQVLNSEKPVLVDFWAEWCGPCRMLTPIIDDIATTMSDKITVYKMNIDEHPKAPTSLGVRSIPTMKLFKNGEVVDTKVGVQNKNALEEWINSLI